MRRRARLLAGAVGAGLLATSALADDLPATIDASGRHGVSGAAGADGSGSGGDGQPAGPSTPGEHAGAIDVTLEPASDGVVRVAGTRVPPRALTRAAGPPAPVELLLGLGRPRGGPGSDGVAGPRAIEGLHLLAVGGDGGNGGPGGQGARGSDGYSGSDATCHSSGGNGGPGGDGGDGGDGTCGSDAGDGADVTVRVRGSDTHLLLLVEPEVRAGRGGAAGPGGAGGSGGSGGRGGSRHGSHGSGNDRCSGNSGGSRGRDGSRGASGATGPAGANGKDGVVRWVVDGEVHEDRYRLTLLDYAIDSADHDGVFEPGERARVHGLRVKNAGRVPTPPPELHPTSLYLPLTRNVSAPSTPLVVPRSLGHDGEADVPGELLWTIPDVDTGAVLRANERWADAGTIDPRAYLADARRDHPEAVATRPFALGFPAGTRPMRFASSIGAGETRKVVLEVENRSTRPLGAEVDGWLAAHNQPAEPARRRALRVTLGFDAATLGPGNLELRDPAGEVVDLAAGAFAWDVPVLGPGEVARCQVSLGVRPDVEAYSGGALAFDLHLGRIGQAPEDRRPIELRRIPVRVSSRWQPRPPATEPRALVLVTNVGVERDVVRAWGALARGLGLELLVWDLSYYGSLPLAARRPTREEPLLVEHAQLVVVLGDPFETPIQAEDGTRERISAARFLAPDEVVRASRKGVGLLVVGAAHGLDEQGGVAGGPGGVPTLSSLLVPSPGGTPRAHASVDALLAALEQDGDAADPERVDVARVEETHAWGGPTPEGLRAAGLELGDALSARWPDRRYLVVTRPAGSALVDGWLWNDVTQGELEVRRVDATDGGVDLLALERPCAADPRLVASPLLLRSVVGALPFDRKLELLRGFLAGALPVAGSGAPSEADLGAALTLTLLDDLEDELVRSTSHAWSGLSTSGSFRPELRRHAALAGLTFAAPLAGERARCAARLVAGVRAAAERRWSAGDLVVPLAARRWYAACAAGGSSLGRGWIDDFADAAGVAPDGDGVARAELTRLRDAATLEAVTRGARPARGTRALTRGWRIVTPADLSAQATVEAAQAAERARFAEALDQLRLQTELGEGLGR